MSKGLEGWSVVWTTHTLGVNCVLGVETDLGTVFLFSHMVLKKLVQVSSGIPQSDRWV